MRRDETHRIVTVDVQGQHMQFLFDRTTLGVPPGLSPAEHSVNLPRWERAIHGKILQTIEEKLQPTVTSHAEAVQAADEVMRTVRPMMRQIVGLPPLN